MAVWKLRVGMALSLGEFFHEINPVVSIGVSGHAGVNMLHAGMEAISHSVFLGNSWHAMGGIIGIKALTHRVIRSLNPSSNILCRKKEANSSGLIPGDNKNENEERE